jgi:uncharacterized membrane protein
MSTLAAERNGSAAVMSAPMTNRMAIAVLALVGLLVSAYMAAYTFGLLGHIACGVGGCQTVQNSPWARFLGVPVSLIGFIGYGALLTAALVGLQPSGTGSRAVATVLAAGATTGLLFSTYLTWLEAFVIHAWCRWCVGSAIIAVGIFLFSLPEFRRLRSAQ